jgi:integrase
MGFIMATLYQNKGHWLLTVHHKGRRLTKSLGTKDKKVAKQLKPYVESELLLELTGLKKATSQVAFPVLTDKFLKADKKRAKKTQELYEYVLRTYNSGKPLPLNPNSRAIFVRTINACWNWGLKQGLVSEAHKLNDDTKGEPRQRVFTKPELDLMFKKVGNGHFNAFVRFAYFTGARSGEIRNIQPENITDGSLIVFGKTGRRIIKISTQASTIITNQSPLWSYSKDYVCHHFKKEVRRLKIKDARFHDLRRTFGLNLIKQGMSIYKVSKLLGHKSVKTTEQHYAPLLTSEIEDFEL